MVFRPPEILCIKQKSLISVQQHTDITHKKINLTAHLYRFVGFQYSQINFSPSLHKSLLSIKISLLCNMTRLMTKETVNKRDLYRLAPKNTEMPHTEIKFGICTHGYYELKLSTKYHNYEILITQHHYNINYITCGYVVTASSLTFQCRSTF